MHQLSKGRVAWAIALATSVAAGLCAPMPAAALETTAGENAQSGIAWRTASTDAEVDAAFAEARAAGKPLFLYWGAVWCPPCNQVKATVFNRADFIARTRAFVPVYVDGDRPG